MIAIIYEAPSSMSEDIDIISVNINLTEEGVKTLQKKANKRNRRSGIYYGLIELEDNCLNNKDW